ncbi:MAG TPA: hypothetical protein VFY53_01180 [Rhodoplanes sp.]|nr:hypothetical protein [Rhodoplanes sp.]
MGISLSSAFLRSSAKDIFQMTSPISFQMQRLIFSSLLNSKPAWFVLVGLSPAVRGGFHEMRVQYVEQAPIPEMKSADRTELVKLGEICTNASARSLEIQSAVRHRILADLAPPERATLSRKLAEWWTLDFAAFRDEVKRVFRIEIPVKERADWETYLAEKGAEACALTAEIEAAEQEIDAIVYRLFDLSPDEIALLEASIAGQC